MKWLARLGAVAVLAGTALALAAAPTSASTFNSTADTYVDASAPTTKFGTKAYVRVDGSPILNSYLRFTVSGVGTTTSAVLRFYAESASSSGVSVHSVADTTWSESLMTYNNAPPMGPILTTTGSFAAASWVSVDVSSVVHGDGTYSFALTETGGTALKITSREGTNKPQLITPRPTTPSPYVISKVGSSYKAQSATSGTTFNGSLKSVVQSAVADLELSGGGIVHFNAGDYDYGTEYFKGTNLHSIVFEGAGMNLTTIRNSTNEAADTEPFNFSGAFGVTIRDLAVSAGGSFRSTSDALDFDQGNDSLVERVKIIASRSRAIVFDGKNLGWTSANNTVRDCVITGSAVQGDGIEFLASSNNRVEGCTITGVGGIGIQMTKSSTLADQPNKKASDNVITGNTITESGQHGVEIISGDRNQITNNTVTNSSNLVASKAGIRITSSDSITCDDNVVTGNVSNDNQAVKTQKFGLDIANALCNRTVVGPVPPNNFTPNVTASIHNIGTGTIFQ